MVDWREIVENRDWDELEQWLGENAFRCSTDDAAERKVEIEKRSAVLRWLQDNVPKTTLENGIESRVRHVFSEEAPNEWKGAAKILELGELEASLEGDPLTDTDEWGNLLSDVLRELNQLKDSKETTKGDETLSRQQHVTSALEFLDQIKKIDAHTKGQLTSKQRQAEMKEAISGAALNAFLAGQHFEAVRKKVIEASAVRGEKVAGGARNSAIETNKKHAALRETRFARMRELIPEMKVAKAAAQCASEGLGTTAAIRGQWYRWREKV